MRLARMYDVKHIMKALLELKAYSPAPQVQLAEPAAAEESVRSAILNALGWFVGGYFIMVDVGREWYSTKPYLIEQIILKVYPSDKSATIDDAIASLDLLRERYACDAIAVGDTQIGYMTPKYLAAGYTPLGTQLYKEKPNGRSTQVDRSASSDRRDPAER